MINPIYLGIPIAAGLAAAWMWPDESAVPLGDDAIVESAYRSGDGHFYVDAKINGASIRFLVDTGASAIALSKKDAAKANIDISNEKFEVVGQGASGIVRGVRLDIEKVELGRIVEEDIEAAVIEGSDVSLLGAPFLRKIDEIVIRGDKMEFRDRPKT